MGSRRRKERPAKKIGLFHPGALGPAVGQAKKMSGHEVLWLTSGRSVETRERAAQAELAGVDTLAEFVRESEAIVSVCPPAHALSIARSVTAAGFTGCYLDANAVAPHTAEAIADELGDGHVDGGIIGLPPTQPGQSRIYLSGPMASVAREWFAGGYFEVHVIGGDRVSASALKMCYAAYTKGISALILATRALAEANGVSDALLQEWSVSQPGLTERSEAIARGTGAKAWRFVAEMHDIASTFAQAGLPNGFHEAAAEIYQRMSPLRSEADVDWPKVARLLNQEDEPDLDQR